MRIINHPKVYERLNWENNSNIPIVINKRIKTYDEDEKESSDCNSEDSNSSFNYGVVHNLGELRQICADDIPEDVIFQYHRFLLWNNQINHYYDEPDLKFISLTVPPNTKITVHKKTTEYGNSKCVNQLSYLRNKIREWIKLCNINSYIIVFERFKSQIIHAHILYIPPLTLEEGYKDLSEIMGYNTYKKMTINIVEEDVTEINKLLLYLCKLKSIED